jgi:prolyl oligopeptidase
VAGCAAVDPQETGSEERAAAHEGDDPWLWLEEIEGERALAWVEKRNAETAERLAARPLLAELQGEALAALTSAVRVPGVTQRGGYLYNFWQDAEHERGILRRTTLAEYGTEEPAWELVLDIDALAASENELWAYAGMSCLPPEHRHCLVNLSLGGGDAHQVRELDTTTLELVDGGFFLPVAKTRIAWRDESSVYVGTDFGPGSLTESGYPRLVKLWRRGTPLSAAETLYEGDVGSVAATANRLRTETGDLDLVSEGTTFWTTKYLQLLDGELVPLAIPDGAVVVDGFRNRLVIQLREPWERGAEAFPAGAVVIADPAALRGGEGTVELVVTPTEREAISAVRVAPQGILVTVLDAVRGRLYRYEPQATGWSRRSIPFPDNGALHITSVDDTSGDFFVEYESFLAPPTLHFVPALDPRPQAVKSEGATFDADGFEVEQLWTTSADGTEIPYFVVAPTDLELDGENPVWMFSYGGFENSLTPSYSGSYEPLHGAYGKLWLERGGVFVLANIRGGGEFGPAWHQAALKENRHKAFEDFEAVARDLVARRITSPEHLGIEGRSNGGLLVGATLLRHPELYGAVVCGAPLLDMRRYDQLLAGASWVVEYGDPNTPSEWEYISKYSPYQNVESGKAYPPVLFYGSTRDDRVHPGHMRKMAARLRELGHEVEYYENTEGGHRGSTTPEQLARRIALTFTFLWRELGPQPDR